MLQVQLTGALRLEMGVARRELHGAGFLTCISRFCVFFGFSSALLFGGIFLHFCIYINHTRPDPATKRISAVPPFRLSHYSAKIPSYSCSLFHTAVLPPLFLGRRTNLQSVSDDDEAPLVFYYYLLSCSAGKCQLCSGILRWFDAEKRSYAEERCGNLIVAWSNLEC